MKLSEFVTLLSAVLIRDGDSYIGYFDEGAAKDGAEEWTMVLGKQKFPNEVLMEVRYQDETV